MVVYCLNSHDIIIQYQHFHSCYFALCLRRFLFYFCLYLLICEFNTLFVNYAIYFNALLTLMGLVYLWVLTLSLSLYFYFYLLLFLFTFRLIFSFDTPLAFLLNFIKLVNLFIRILDTLHISFSLLFIKFLPILP